MWAKKNHLNLFLYSVSKHYPITIFDTETTGLSKTDYIVQFAGQRLEYNEEKKNYEVTKDIDIFIKPPIIMSQEVIEIHGLTNEFLATKPTEDECFNEIFDFLNYPSIIMGYNVSFDIKMVKGMFERQGKNFNPTSVVDVYQMVRESCIKADNSNDRKLETMTRYFKLDEDISFHSSADDVLATWRVAQHLCHLYINTLNNDKNIIPVKGFLSEGTVWNKSKYVNRIYCTIIAQGKRFYLYYDNFYGCWCTNKDTPSDIARYLDMDDIHEQLIMEAKRQMIQEKWNKMKKENKLNDTDWNTFYTQELSKISKIKPDKIKYNFHVQPGGEINVKFA